MLEMMSERCLGRGAASSSKSNSMLKVTVVTLFGSIV